MIAHSGFSLPDEACGLLAGDEAGRLRMAYCLSNIDSSPVSYTVDPGEHLAAWRHAERNGWELSGVFHSHVTGDAVPSATDVTGALDSTWLYVIVGRASSRPTVRAYWIREGRVVEEPLEIVGQTR